MSSYLQQLSLVFLYPLIEYLDKVTSHRVSPNYPAVFKWACLKRFQELFDKNSQGCPHNVLPEFFTEQQQFGMCTEVHFAKRIWPLLRITKSWNSNSSRDIQTASPEKWSILLTNIDGVLADAYRLKPRPKPTSSTALLVTTIQKKKKLMVGLSVKLYTPGAFFGKAQLEDEFKLFNRMFDTYAGMFDISDDRLNVLVVCSTHFSDGLKEEFEATGTEGKTIVRNSVVHSTEGFPNIHEVILLNLSTPEQRAKFLGIQDEALQKSLESIIEKAEAAEYRWSR